MKISNTVLALGAIGLYFLSQRNFGIGVDKRAAIIAYASRTGNVDASTRDIFQNQMTDSEINTVYNAFFNYIDKNVSLPQSIQVQMDIIGQKYGIFT